MVCILNKMEDQMEDKDKTKEQLIEELKQFKTALNNSSTVVFHQDRELRYTWIHNPHPSFDPQSVLGKTDLELLPSKDAYHLTEIKNKVIESGIGAKEEVRTTIEGIPYFYDLNIEPLKDSNNKVIGVSCVSTDISNHRRNQKDQYELMQTLLNSLPDLVLVINEDGEYTDIKANKNTEGILFKSKEEVIGKTIQETFPKELSDLFMGVFHKTIETGEIQTLEYTLDVPAGKRTFEGRISKLETLINGKRATLSVVRDITDRKESEEKLRLNEQTLDYMAEGVYLIQTETGNIAYTNPKFEKMFGYDPGEMIGKHVSIVNAPIDKTPEQVADEITQMLNQLEVNGVWEGEVLNIKKDGTPFWCAATVSTFEHSTYGQVWIAVHQDLTEKKQLEAQLRQSQKMEAIGVLTGGIAHEFNNLLMPILGNTEMLLSEHHENDSDFQPLSHIQIAGNRAAVLIRQMMAYGRKSTSQRTSVKLENIVNETITLLERTIPSNISIKKDITPDLPPMLGMPNEIHQVIFNLCINASHAMPDGGELTIALKREGDFIVLRVTDTGTGMSQATVERMFDPFFTTKEVGKGSGLGLSVVQGIVDQHKGHIEVNTTLGKGTTFNLYFPVAESAVKPDIVVKSEPLSKGNERILLIDDEPMITTLTKSMLGKLGYKVTEFIDCALALKLFTDHPQDFDLVITDYGMPQMSGKQLADKIKEIRPDIPVVLFTGHGDLVTKENIHTWGMNDLLIKPFEFKELSDVVRGVLGKRPEET